MSKKVLVIGATGSTGCHLTDALANHDFQVLATGRHPRTNPYYEQHGIEYFQLDISVPDSFSHLPASGIDCVVLLAGAMPARMRGYDPSQYLNVNITGTLNVLEYCRRTNIPKIIFAQSHSDVAGHWNTGKLIPADAPRSLHLKGDHAVYIISKCAAVDLIEHYHQSFGIQSIYFRMPTVYCYWPSSIYYVDGQPKEMAYLGFIRKALAGEPLEIWGDPKAGKDIVYIKDFVQMLELAIVSPTAQGFYNVGSGIPTTLEEQIKGVADVFCQPGKMSEIRYRPDMPTQPSFFYDISRTVNELGFVTRFPYPRILEDMKSEMSSFKFRDLVVVD